MSRRVDLKTIAYYTSIAALLVGSIWAFVEAHDAWVYDENTRKAAWKTLAAILGITAAAIMILNPPE